MKRDWWLISDIDGTLTGDDVALYRLRRLLETEAERIGFGVASGRSPELVSEAVTAFGLPQPELVIAAVGSEVFHRDIPAGSWPGELADTWLPERIGEVLEGVEGVEPQAAAGQGPYKLGFLAAPEAAAAAVAALHNAGLAAELVPSAGEFLDVMPAGVSKGSAVRFAAEQLQVPLSRVIVAGDTGNDVDMLTCGAPAILVANHSSEVAHLADDPRVYVARRAHAAGILEGLVHYGVIREV